MLYDCKKCPAYCCSYPIIALTKRDVARLAKHFTMTPELAEKRYTKKAYGHERVMRRKTDRSDGILYSGISITNRGVSPRNRVVFNPQATRGAVISPREYMANIVNPGTHQGKPVVRKAPMSKT